MNNGPVVGNSASTVVVTVVSTGISAVVSLSVILAVVGSSGTVVGGWYTKCNYMMCKAY